MSWTPERIARERRFIEQEKRRIARARPLTWQEKEEIETREWARRQAELAEEERKEEAELVETLRELGVEPETEVKERLQELPYEPTEEELEAFKRVAETANYLVQEHFRAFRSPQVTRIVENGDKTICMNRPMKIIVQDPVTKQKIESREHLSPEKCRVFPIDEMQCIRKKQVEDCEKVKRSFACANDMTVTQVSALNDIERSEAQRCIREIELIKSPDRKFLGEPIYSMPRDRAQEIQEDP